MMNDDLFHAQLKELYHPPQKKFTLIDVPEIRYMMIEGAGDPEKADTAGAMKWLYAVVHLIKPYAEEQMGKRFVYPPIEFLFWADDDADFISGNKEKWKWRAMVVLAEFIPEASEAIFNEAAAKVETKLGPAPGTLKLDYLHEGKCVQTMIVGDYDEVAGVCEKLYTQFLPENTLMPNGYYHEIYLNDPARVAPGKRKIVVRQPVCDLKN